ncbi:MAG: HPr family phosphocarrier protein [Elusimicrobiota bacterium]|jgi:phosphocarrier protein|nr:HPr family phosphocarrier protein [Elusimicrobiota bacterium]
MIEKTITVKFQKGLHARPAALLVEMLSEFKTTEVKVVDEQTEIDAKSIMGILILAAAYGTQLKFIIDGQAQDEVSKKLDEFFNSHYDGE